MIIKFSRVAVTFLLSAILLATFNSYAAGSKGDVSPSYSITIDDSNHRLAKVRAVMTTQDEFLYMAPGAQILPRRWATFIGDLKVFDGTGNPVAATELPDAKWKLDIAGPTKITVTYSVRLDHEKYEWPGGIDGVAYATDWGVFWTSRALLIMNGADRSGIAVDFKLPAAWRVTAPWKPVRDDPNSFIAKNQTDLSEAMIFAGTHREISVKRSGFELIFALGGEEIVSRTEEFRKMSEGVMDYYITLMGGVPKPRPANRFERAVVIINSANNTDGEVIGNNISLLVDRGGGEMAKLFSTFIFAHEFFHFWNGKSITPKDDDCEWFKEGVSNYYTIKALHHVGFLDEPGFFRAMNSIFYQRYRTDPGLGKIALTAGGEKHDHWGIIYGGGMFAGIAQDLMIRKSSGNRKSLDDLMRALYKRYGGTDDEYTLDEIRRRLSDLNGSDQSEFFKRYVAGNSAIPINEFLPFAGLDATIEDGNLKVIRSEKRDPAKERILAGLLGTPKR